VVYDHGLGEIELPAGIKNVMWVSRKALPRNTSGLELLFITADVLRENGAMISKAVSWERSVMNLLWHLRNNDRINHLLQIPRILVTFAEDGVLYVENKNGVISGAWLYLLSGRSEGHLHNESIDPNGHLGDAFYIMAVAAAVQLPDIIVACDAGEQPLFPQLGRIIESGALFVRKGYETDSSIEKCDYEIVQSGNDGNAMHKIDIHSGGNTQPPDTYLIANTGNEAKTIKLAENYVKFGGDCIKGLPILEIGGLKSIDRWEIEAFHNIRNVILEYSKSKEQQPLSIAVFGTPGSGKSFGVKQIAKSLLGKDALGDVTFNVSQFSDETDLGAAFQQVRDIILKGKLPLVFFDEFDSDERKWLKYFLMPMQDGEFKDSSGVHPLGKCILVFAGGTATSFDEFSTAKPDEMKAFKDQKAPDFVSRVKASINIAGPNPRSSDDKNYILRRALLLRSFCERFGISYIDDNVLRAMLLVPQFKHGARSMETIIKMSKIGGGKWTPAGLPVGEQMKIHVSDRKFTDILLIDAICASPKGQIAMEIHRRYCKEMADTGVVRPNVKPWDELAMEFKLSNLNQAQSYEEKLRLIGCKMEPIDATKAAVLEFTAGETLLMAKQEHERWMQEKLEEGWSYSPVRNDDKKLHDCLVSWEDLTDEVRNWDMEPVRNIVSILQSQGYGIYRK